MPLTQSRSSSALPLPDSMVEIGGRDTTSYAGCRHGFKREVRLDSLAGTSKLIKRTASRSRKRFVRSRPTTAMAGGHASIFASGGASSRDASSF
jgi:hypothetical protein